MAKASPHIRGFNAGVFSALLEGRTDIEFYPASMRRAVNCILTPQGPVICRSGSRFVVPVSDETEVSSFKAFIYNTEQAKTLEFAADRIRFIDEDGVQVYAPVAATVTNTSPFTLDIPTLTAAPGDEIVFGGFPANFNINGEVAKIVSFAGTVYTMDRDVDLSVTGTGTAELVYAVPISYTEDERRQLKVLQDVDIMYLLCGTQSVRKLSRFGDYDWRLSDVTFIDGPYKPVNDTPTTIVTSGTGNAVPTMTSNTAPSGTASGSSLRNSGTAVAANGTFLGRTYQIGLPATDYWHAFDNSDDTYWASNTAQTGTLQYTPAAAFVCTGYTIYASLDNNDVTYLNTDFAPSTFFFEGYDGANWITLDYEENYVAYDHDRSIFFEFQNTVAYAAYRLRVLKVVHNGQIEARVRRLVMRSATAADLTLTASDVVGINRDTGFKQTDIGRLIRVLGSDNSWRWLIIKSVTSTTVITAALQNTPFLTTKATTDWRLGIWSDTTGWPATGDFFLDRLYLGPSNEDPNVVCGSVVGLYENFTHVEEDGEVLDDGGIVHYIKSPQLSRLKWLISTDKGLVAGTGSQEFLISKSSLTDRNLTPANIQSVPTTSRGSTDANAIKVDKQILHVPRSGRLLRELSYDINSDGLVSSNLSRFSSHLGVPGFTAQAFANEPHTIDWVLRGDGSLVALTYNKDEGVVGWGNQDFAGAIVESILVIPQKDQQQDALWLETRRTINGQDRRYIEYMTRPWDFGMTLDDAIFVDCAIVYDGTATTTLYGAQHLEGQTVYGLARVGTGTDDDPYAYQPIEPTAVVNGSIELPFEAEHVVLGLGYDSEGEISRLENGAASGTSQGLKKRIPWSGLLVWDTAAGQLGTYSDDTETYDYEDIEIPGAMNESDQLKLYTEILPRVQLDSGYSTRGTISFKRPKETPVPFNLVALMPNLDTEDTP